MKTPIFGQTYVARSVNAADNRMVNLFPEVLIDGKEAGYLNRAPGLEFLQSVGIGPWIRIFTIRRHWPYSWVMGASN
jgi:hypothetical protein